MAPPRAPVPHVVRPTRPRTATGRAVELLMMLLLAPLLLVAMVGWMLGRLSAFMPGVTVTTETAPSGGDVTSDAGAAYFVTGLTERGAVDGPVLVRSMTEYRHLLGNRVTYGTLYDDLETFFSEGGGRAWVARVVGAAATVGTLTLNDRAGVPVPTLRIDAKDPGVWAQDVTIEVADGVLPDTYRLIVRHDGDIVETHDNLPDPPAAVAALTTSGYVRATDLGSATAPPANNPAVLAPTALAPGSDDRAAVTAADHVAALARFSTELGAGAVAIPGQPHTAVATDLVAHARTRRRIALLATPEGQTVQEASAAARALRVTTGAEHAGLFYPWVQIPDGGGGVRTISPEGFTAGVRARTIAQRGPWQAPAGEFGTGRHVTGVERELTPDEVDSLTDDHTNCIRLMNAVVRLYGWRSLSADTVNYRFLTARDVMNNVAAQAEARLEQFVFRTIDGRGQIFVEVDNELTDIVEPVRAGGGLYERVGSDGAVLDPGYLIDTGPTINTPATIAAGEIRAQLSLRTSPVGELVHLIIRKVSLRAEL